MSFTRLAGWSWLLSPDAAEAALLQLEEDLAALIDRTEPWRPLRHALGRASKVLEESRGATTGENIFTMIRKIGSAKAALAADYATQLARSAGKVVFFAKHIDVMDQAEATFARRDIRSVSIRGDQTAADRERAVDSFLHDKKTKAVVCSLTAAGVGLNLQVASNVVLA